MGRLIALEGMLAFRCLGADCEDTCCRDWAVPVTAAKAERLEAALGAAAAVVAVPGAELPFRLAFGAGERCPHLAGGLCSVQTRYGQDPMPDACIAFPRHMRRRNGDLEFGGDLGCPEVGRLLLLGDAGTALVSLATDNARPERPGLEDLVAEGDPRAAQFTALQADGPLRVRLATAVERAFGAPAGAAARAAPAPLAEVDLVRRILATCLVSDHRPVFRDWVRERLADLVPGGGLPTAAVLRASYLARAAAFEGPDLDGILARYARHFWFRDDGAGAAPGSPGLAERLVLLLVRMAVLRVLLAAQAGGPDDLARAAVETTVRLARELDHDASFRCVLAGHLRDEKVVSFERAAALAAF